MVLFITGLMGLPGLCSFINAFSVGGRGFFLHQELYLPLINYQVALLEDTL